MKKLIIILAAIPLAIFSFVSVGLYFVHNHRGLEFSYENNGTDMSFSSSDGIWRTQEDMLNGYNFQIILTEFRAFQVRCQRPNIKLWRTKAKKYPYKWAWWFDVYASPKWALPYVAISELPTPKTGANTCS